MKRLTILTAILLAMGAAGCSSSSDTTPAAGPFQQPAGTVAVNFSVDDTANHAFRAGEMQWKGSMLYHPADRTITRDTTWAGPFPELYDDGPWNVATIAGHEPAGSVAGDHIWGVTVFVKPPAAGSDAYEYGLIDHAFGDGWMWAGPNGTFAVASTASGHINATGMTIPAWGTVDLKLVLDATQLPTTAPITSLKVKGSGWSWNEIALSDDGTTQGDPTAGDKSYTFEFGSWAGAGKTYYHSGLLHSGDQPEFIFVYNGKEYKNANGEGEMLGVTAFSKTGATWDPLVVGTVCGRNNGNTCVIIP